MKPIWDTGKFGDTKPNPAPVARSWGLLKSSPMSAEFLAGHPFNQCATATRATWTQKSEATTDCTPVTTTEKPAVDETGEDTTTNATTTLTTTTTKNAGDTLGDEPQIGSAGIQSV